MGCYSALLVPSLGVSALAVAWALVGPPKLPPLPGERPAEPVEPTPAKPAPIEPKGPAPQKPTATPIQPSTPQPQPLTPVAPTPSRPTVPLAARPTPPPGLPTVPPPTGQPEVMEPPQPEPRGPVPADPEQAGGERSVARGKPAGAELVPDGDEDERPRLRLPPPRRPPYAGVGLFVGAGVTFSAALAEQIVAHVLIKRRCIEPFAAQAGNDATTPEEAEQEVRDFADALVRCAPGVLPAVVLRVQSDLGLLATIGLAAAGAAARAHRKAYDDVFADRPARPMLGLRIAGVGLLGTGVVTWLTTGAVSWSLLGSCRDAKCATRARLMAFTTRDTGAVLIAAGAGLLTYAVAHGRAHDRYFRDRALSLGASWLPGGGGLSLSGRF
jgi:hypothetical protein